MELDEFIKNVFINIIDGVKASQEHAINKNARVAPSPSESKTTKGNSIKITYIPSVKDVEFEIILCETVKDNKKVGVGVLLSGFGGNIDLDKGSKENLINTKIKFSIPLVFPIVEN